MAILKCLKFPSLNLVTRACAGEFFDTLTEGMVHGVHKVMTRSCFSVIWQHKVSEGKWGHIYTTVVLTVIYSYTPCPISGHVPHTLWIVSIGYTKPWKSMIYESSWEAVPPQSKTSSHRVYCLWCQQVYHYQTNIKL